MAAVRSAALGAGGSLIDAWRDEVPLPEGLISPSVVAFARTIVVVGGFATSGLRDTVLVSTADDQGRLGPWVNAGVVTPGFQSGAASDGKFVHLVGGQTGGQARTGAVFAAPIAGGVPGDFAPTSPLPFGRSRFALVRLGDLLVATGGLMEDGGVPGGTALGLVQADGGVAPWTDGPLLPLPLFDHAAVAAGDWAYVLGGFSSNLSDAVYRSQASGSGTLSAWVPTVSLPSPRYDACAATFDGFIYVIGGVGDPQGNPIPDVVVDAVNPGGALGPWSVVTPYPTPIARAVCAAL